MRRGPLPVVRRADRVPHRRVGRGHVTGVASWLFYVAGLIVTAMVAASFGSYGASLFFGDDAAGVWVNVLASVVIVAINAVGAGTVAKVQSAIVALLLGVFAIFIAVTLADAHWDLLAPSTSRRRPTSWRASL